MAIHELEPRLKIGSINIGPVEIGRFVVAYKLGQRVKDFPYRVGMTELHKIKRSLEDIKHGGPSYETHQRLAFVMGSHNVVLEICPHSNCLTESRQQPLNLRGVEINRTQGVKSKLRWFPE